MKWYVIAIFCILAGLGYGMYLEGIAHNQEGVSLWYFYNVAREIPFTIIFIIAVSIISITVIYYYLFNDEYLNLKEMKQANDKTIKELEIRLSQAKQAHDKKVTDLDQQLLKKENARRQYEYALMGAKQEIRGYKQLLTIAEKSVNEKANELFEQYKITNNQSQKDLQKTLIARENKIADLEAEIAGVYDKLDELERQNNEAYKITRNEAKNSGCAYRKIRVKIKTLEKENTELTNQNRFLQDQNEKLLAENKSLSAKIEYARQNFYK